MLDHYRTPLARIPFAAVSLISFAVLFTPASGVPSAPPGTDKAVHFALFAGLAITGCSAGIRPSPLIVGLACYAGVSEVIQAAAVDGRSGDVADALTDLLGAGAGLAAYRATRGRTRSATTRALGRTGAARDRRDH
ncbi:VanZ family protein [Parasphingorhabdus pacifica]